MAAAIKRPCLGLGVGLSFLALTFAVAGGQSGAPSHEEYLAASKLATTFSWTIYEAYGDRVRFSEMSRKCGYKKEADELDENTKKMVNARLDQLVMAAIGTQKSTTMSQMLITREGATSWWSGYRLGYRESFTTISDTLTARTYEDVCKMALKNVKDMIEKDRP